MLDALTRLVTVPNLQTAVRSEHLAASFGNQTDLLIRCPINCRKGNRPAVESCPALTLYLNETSPVVHFCSSSEDRG